MKKLLLILAIASCIGCSTKHSNVDEKRSNETSSFNAFNDESYVWEGWSFSTNKVDNIK